MLDRAYASTSRGSAGEADARGLVYLSVLSSVESAEALLGAGDPRQARQEIDRALPRAESSVCANCTRGANTCSPPRLRTGNDPQAPRHYALAAGVLDQMKAEEGGQRVLERADLKALHAQAVRRAGGN